MDHRRTTQKRFSGAPLLAALSLGLISALLNGPAAQADAAQDVCVKTDAVLAAPAASPILWGTHLTDLHTLWGDHIIWGSSTDPVDLAPAACGQ